ncbi:ribosomal protein L6e-domain-containing protein [Massariosphaeria phaeospora]|uniref:Ribosomal protein L6e-domain-containing protein n=1 Tax=Massariosphaeria phaeospora TaxID=100035 RepID=A0A7C8I3F6_9PLEO|nr:ribosomal protein L6e-domain-containing protein [Massariosphaeria phaeospora]
MADQKASKYYPAEEDAQLRKARKSAHPTKYRDSLAPGTVLILLSGRFRGKRVVLLRQLSQGVLLITGPFKSNGVPLRRVNHRYVIATSTVVDITGVEDEVLDRVSKDEYWAREKKEGKGEEEFFGDAEAAQKKETDPQRIEDQKKVDKVIVANVKKVADLEAYLGSSFSLSSSERPHEMVF